ncbi:MAG: cation transporter [Bacilli bacterium]|nr:cation transporter [Bacilli bacterium]MBO6195732.1 cation transporter [Bacilli bacterium]
MKTEKNILIAFILNLLFSCIEFIGGMFTGSIAILSDSIHDLGDALSIGLSYFLEKKSKKSANNNYTYGYIKYSIIGSVITTVILIIGSIFVIIGSIKRIIYPVEINYNGMLLLSIFGVVINFIAAYFTKEGDSLNQKSVNLHMMEDVLGWLVVLIGSIVMKFTDISIIDSVLSLLVSIFILYKAVINFKKILDVFLEKTPSNIDIEKLNIHLFSINGVKDIHHVHIRSIDGYNNIGTFHIVVDKYDKEIKDKIKEELLEFGINHSTIEFELPEENCHSEECKIEVKTHHHNHHH